MPVDSTVFNDVEGLTNHTIRQVGACRKAIARHILWI